MLAQEKICMKKVATIYEGMQKIPSFKGFAKSLVGDPIASVLLQNFENLKDSCSKRENLRREYVK